MDISITITDWIPVIALHGSFLGGKDSTLFTDAIKNCIDQRCAKIIIDLAGLDYMNSVGLGSIFAGYTSSKNAGGKFMLANATPRVAELLRLTKTDSVLPVFATVEEARTILTSK